MIEMNSIQQKIECLQKATEHIEKHKVFNNGRDGASVKYEFYSAEYANFTPPMKTEMEDALREATWQLEDQIREKAVQILRNKKFAELKVLQKRIVEVAAQYGKDFHP